MKISQEEAAHRAAVTVRHYQRIEHGNTDAGLDVLLRVAKALGTTLQALMDRADALRTHRPRIARAAYAPTIDGVAGENTSRPRFNTSTLVRGCAHAPQRIRAPQRHDVDELVYERERFQALHTAAALS